MHRGTLDGMWTGNNIGIAVRRLPIIDILHSPQPMFNEDRSLVLAGNGEIFNFKELRAELRTKGHKFRTKGDLECILHLYEEYGNQLWNKLRGQYAIAIYDIPRDTLLLARDPLGIKPLFYYRKSSLFLFGSEIKSLKSHPSFESELHPQAIADFLSLQFVPKPQTIYKDVYSLPPGSTLVLKEGKIELVKFWEIAITSDGSSQSRETIAAESLRLLKTSIKRRLISDVPLGILLSGGVDSSALAALASEMAEEPIKTFAIVFKEKSFDESEYSRLMAEYLKSDHHELVLDAVTMLDSMEEISYYFDEPFCEGSTFPIYHICRYAKDYVTVILSGEGADEIFGGYETYSAQHMARYYRILPAPVRRALHYIAHKLPVSDNKVSLDMKLRRFTDGVKFNPPKAHFWFRASMNDSEKRKILNRDFISGLDRLETSQIYEDVFSSFASSDVLNKLMATDCLIHLVDDLLLRADRMSMAHTMELRVPYLDIDLVNYAFSIPSAHKIKGLFNKIPLRDAVKNVIPEKIRKRGKRGLNMPYQKWFKQKGWKELLHDSFQKENIETLGIFNYEGVQTMLTEHVKGIHNHAHALWTTLNLILWLKNNAS